MRPQNLQQIKRSYYLVTFLFWFATILPGAVSVLLVQARGLDLFQIGIFLGIYSLTIVLLEIPTGGLADAVGRKRVTVLALLFTLASLVVFLFAFSFAFFLLYALLAGAGRALMSGALLAWFIDSLHETAPDADIQPPLAVAGTVELVALGLGTLLGGFLPTLFGGLPAEGTAVLTPLSVTVFSSALMMMLTLLAVLLLIREDRAGRGAENVRGVRALPQIVGEAFRLSRRNPTILLLLGATLASGLALGSVETFWQPRFAVLLGGSEGNSVVFGVLLAGSFGLGALGNLLATPLSRFFGKRYALVAALFQGLGGLTLVLLALQTYVTAAAALFWLVYFSRGVINSPHAALFNREAPKARRSAMLSVQSLAAYAGLFLGSSVLGYVAENFSINLAWTVSGVALGASLLFYLGVGRLEARAEKRASPKQ